MNRTKMFVFFLVLVCFLMVFVSACDQQKDVIDDNGTNVEENNDIENNNSNNGQNSENDETYEPINADDFDYITTVKSENGVSIKYVSFDDIAPEGYTLLQDWDGMGMDDQGRVYIGWTSMRSDGREDYVVFMYDNKTGERKLLGTFMQASEKAGNLEDTEQIPKGHTKFIQVGNKIYMGSQGFHDFKQSIDALPNYRGSHIYAYDMEKDTLEDISASLPGGVVTENQGIVAMTYMPEQNYLVGLSHPHSDIVLFDIDKGAVEKIVPGIPWSLGNPVGREIVATKYGKIYTYRGTERSSDRNKSFNMWEYDIKTDVMAETEYKFSDGFWNAQTETKDGSKIYISTNNGRLYVLHTESGEVSDLGYFYPKEEVNRGNLPSIFYTMTLSNDEKKIYGLPSLSQGDLYEYDIESGVVKHIVDIGKGYHTGNDAIDSNGYLYFARFDKPSGNCRLMVIDLSEYDKE